MQGRDPFSGDCDIRKLPDGPSPGPLGPPCKDETRFQGIATTRLAPTGRGGRRHPLQGRDPFSGDCDPAVPVAPGWAGWVVALARTRPVFRGLRLGRAGKDQDPGRGHLARTRPVFRGLRLGSREDTLPVPPIRLARTRPVFRGLRRREGVGDEADRVESDRTSSPARPGKKGAGGRGAAPPAPHRLPPSRASPPAQGENCRTTASSCPTRRPGPTKSGHTRR